jgi:general secretion pathway protein A
MITSRIYQDFYGLREKPFNLTPDPKFLCLTEKHQEALDHLLYGLEQKTGFILFLGEVGAGKTTVCRALLERLDQDYVVALILHPFLAEENLLATIIRDLGVVPRGETKRELLDQLNAFILARKVEGKTVALIFDESQNLSPKALEEIRVLSNLETDKEKLLQIVLIGQKELETKLARKELRQLNQRIGVRYYLYPLDRQETGRYLAHRLQIAGDPETIRFTKGAVREIFSFSKGIPRLINLAADRALLAGYVKGTKTLTREMAGRGIRSLSGRPDSQERQYPQESLTTVSVLIMALIVLGGFFLLWAASHYWEWGEAPNAFILTIPAGFLREHA